MRIIRHLSNREKILVSFLVLLVLMNGFTIIVSRNITGISYSFRSMLEDRLIPSLYLFQVQEGVYKNRLLLEEMIYFSGQTEEEMIWQIQENNEKIDQVILKLSQTSLTSDEAEALGSFYDTMKGYREAERQVIRMVENGEIEKARSAYLKRSLATFEDLLLPMHDLEDIQLTVGEGLYAEAEHAVSSIQLMAYLNMGIALMVTVYMLKVLRFKVK